MQKIKVLFQKYRWLKFLLVGGVGVPIHFGILCGLTEIGLFYAVSALIAILIAMSVNYTLNNIWTFKDQQNTGKGFFYGWGKYALVSGAGDGIYLGMMIGLVEEVHLHYVIAAAISMFIVMILRYAIVKKLIWRTNNGCSKSV